VTVAWPTRRRVATHTHLGVPVPPTIRRTYMVEEGSTDSGGYPDEYCMRMIMSVPLVVVEDNSLPASSKLLPLFHFISNRLDQNKLTGNGGSSSCLIRIVVG
jgi:hypothetical protein